MRRWQRRLIATTAARNRRHFLRNCPVMLPLCRIIAAELRRLGADTVHVTENGGRKHPKIHRAHLKRNYEAETRRRVRKFLAARSA